MLLYFLKLNISLCINWIVLILLCISIFLGPYVKFIDYKMDKKIEKNKQIRRKINEECKIDYKWKYFFSPIDLKKNILKLDCDEVCTTPSIIPKNKELHVNRE